MWLVTCCILPIALFLSLSQLPPLPFQSQSSFLLVANSHHISHLCLSSILFPASLSFLPHLFEVSVIRSMSFYFLISRLLSCCFLSIVLSCLSIHSFKRVLERVYIVPSQGFSLPFLLSTHPLANTRSKPGPYGICATKKKNPHIWNAQFTKMYTPPAPCVWINKIVCLI